MVIVCRAYNLEFCMQAIVNDVKEVPDHNYHVELDKPLPDTNEPLLLYSVNQVCTNLEIRDCVMREHHARGMLIKAKNVQIANNFLYNTQLTAIEFAPEDMYAEGPESENVVIRGNCIYDCGAHTEITGKEFCYTGGILFQISWKDHAVAKHRNILIEDNLIHCPKARHGITLHDVDGALIRNNAISVRSTPVVIDALSCRDITLEEVKEYEFL